MNRLDKPLIGVAIAGVLTIYATAARRRAARLPVSGRAGNGRHGRHADEPEQLGWRGWRDVLVRVFGNIGRDNVSLMAAGVGFYALLSLAPTFTGLVALYGLMFDRHAVAEQVASLEGMVPAEARRVIAEQLTTIVDRSPQGLGIGLVISMALALWGANSGTSALMQALNVAYGEREKRSMLLYYGQALLMTFALIVFGIIALLLVAILPAIFGFLPLGDLGKEVVSAARWPLLVLFWTTGLAAIYRYAPSRSEPRWSWVSWGAVAATVLWVIGSALFSIYVGEFATYDKTYGSLGAVVVLLMWFWLSAFAILLGAELNAEMERQTVRDTTDPPRKPLGWRGAYAADTVAPLPR